MKAVALSKEENKREAKRQNTHHTFQLSEMFSSGLGEGKFEAFHSMEIKPSHI